MKNKTKYTSPQIEVLDFVVEQGFAGSKGFLGNEGETGPELGQDDYNTLFSYCDY